MVDALAEHDYIAKAPHELTIKKGDIIRDVVRKQDGWWEGVLNEKRGIFPDTFVRPIDKEPPSSVVYRNKKDSAASRTRRCRVAFSYKQDHEDELNLNVGDVIEVLGEEEEGWWRGLLNGREGVFPSNFVVEIVGGGSREDLTNAVVDEKLPTLPPKPEKLLCEVKFPYKALNSDELTLKVGDIVTILNQEAQDPGWWYGELNGHTGVFPDNFVIVLSGGDDKQKSDKKQKPIHENAIKPSSIAQQRKSLEKSEKSDGDVNKTTPPLPGKKPFIPIKKSPSGGTSSGGLFSGIRKKLTDAVDGSGGSKPASSSKETTKTELNSEHSSENAFDQVERRPLLADVRATRAKAPGRRPPSVVFKEGELGIVNGTTDHPMLDSVTEHQPTTTPTTPEPENPELKPKLREWEKHKAPWLEEMKLNQAKRTSTSPGPEQNKLKLTPSSEDELASPPKEGGSSPIEMSKSMSALSRLKAPPGDSESKLNNVVIRSRPVPQRPQTIHHVNEAQTPQKTPPTTTNRLTSPLPKPKPGSFNENSGDFQPEFVTYKQYTELLERLERLEDLVRKQNEQNLAAVEQLKNKLAVETELRVALQSELEKVGQNVMHF